MLPRFTRNKIRPLKCEYIILIDYKHIAELMNPNKRTLIQPNNVNYVWSELQIAHIISDGTLLTIRGVSVQFELLINCTSC